MILDLFSSSKMAKELIEPAVTKRFKDHRAELCERNLMVEAK
jgi:hypothetical protein